MSPVGKGELSLTKFYRLRELVKELGSVRPGMSIQQVCRALGSGHKELADDLVLYTDADGRALDDPLLVACRAHSPDAPILVWAALAMADHRIALVAEKVLTDAHGKIKAAAFNADQLENELKLVLPGMGTRKAATNILSYYRDSGIVTPEMHANTIVGVRTSNPTAHAVPALIAYVAFRLQHLGLASVPRSDHVGQALRVRANKWINLTREEFRAGARGRVLHRLSTRRGPAWPDGTSGHGESRHRPRAAGSKTSIREVAVEAHNIDRFAVSGRSDRIAARREQPLVLDYKRWMERRGSKVVRLRYGPAGETDGIYCDLYDKTRSNLIEAKATATRFAMRMAVGQLLDYRRYMAASPNLAVLAPARPSADLEALLGSVGIAAVWRYGREQFRDNAGGTFV